MYYTFKTYICQLVPGTRIELVIKAYQASVIPFNYPGKNMVDRRGIEPRLKACKAPVLPLSLSAHIGCGTWNRTRD